MKKRLAIFFMSLIMVVTMSGCGNGKKAVSEMDSAMFQAGTYEGVGKGKNGDIVAVVEVSEDSILSINFKEHSETPGISDPAFEKLPETIIKNKTVAVDAISGATVTSNGILEAVKAALLLAGATEKDITKVVEDNTEYESVELTTDVVIIGSGGAGLSAAIEAANAGADVIVLEKLGTIGGNTARAGGGINGAGTKYQEAVGIIDNPDAFYNSVMSKGVTFKDTTLLRQLVDGSESAVEFLHELGADVSVIIPAHGDSVARTHRPKEGKPGATFAKVMQAKVESQGTKIITNTAAKKLIVENNAVVGVEATSETDRKNYKINAKSVVIATGGFSANNEMVTKYDERLAGLGTTNSPGNVGDGIEMAIEVGAVLENMHKINVMSPLSSAVSDVIAVSQDGVRFAEEYDWLDMDNFVKINEGKAERFVWLILDDTARNEQAGMQSYFHSEVPTANSIEELAKMIDIEGDVLTKTVNTWNKAVESKNDAEFGRKTGMNNKIEKAPFYAIKLVPNVHHTAGGIRIDGDTHVLNGENQPIKNLFAAGEVTGGVHDGTSSLTDIIVHGRIAGKNAALNTK
ncbi:flavocytochrome c [Desulfitobacterium sp. THU1]|uniref:flavocytochrome c n=1 Tax=Desulfitobacterium sp. THU1 TaxID=3138072 RepID=UPI0031203389